MTSQTSPPNASSLEAGGWGWLLCTPRGRGLGKKTPGDALAALWWPNEKPPLLPATSPTRRHSHYSTAHAENHHPLRQGVTLKLHVAGRGGNSLAHAR